MDDTRPVIGYQPPCEASSATWVFWRAVVAALVTVLAAGFVRGGLISGDELGVITGCWLIRQAYYFWKAVGR